MKRRPAAVVVFLLLTGPVAAAQAPGGMPGTQPRIAASVAASWSAGVDVAPPRAAGGPVQPLTLGVQARSWELAFEDRKPRWGSVDWVGLFTQQTRVDATMHWLRLFQPKFHEPLYHSQFYKGYADALKGYFSHAPRWSDGDGFVTNDIGHPIMGAVFAYTFTDYDRRCAKTVYGDAGYWSCIRRAAAYAAFASANWEWNPLMSESALGHIGKYYSCERGRCTGEGGWTDLVMTPLAGIGVRIAGDVARAKLWPKLDRGMSGNAWSKALAYTLKTATAPGHFLNCAFKLDFRDAWASTTAAARKPEDR